MIKKIIKNTFPEYIKKKLRGVENFFLRLKYAFSCPIIIKNKDNTKIILEPKNKTPIRWIISKSSYQKELAAIKKIAIQKNNLFFDVGANIGMITISTAKTFKQIYFYRNKKNNLHPQNL